MFANEVRFGSVLAGRDRQKSANCGPSIKGAFVRKAPFKKYL
jgi:hypothetical protein